jgi:hypothetical protein
MQATSGAEPRPDQGHILLVQSVPPFRPNFAVDCTQPGAFANRYANLGLGLTLGADEL